MLQHTVPDPIVGCPRLPPPCSRRDLDINRPGTVPNAKTPSREWPSLPAYLALAHTAPHLAPCPGQTALFLCACSCPVMLVVGG